MAIFLSYSNRVNQLSFIRSRHSTQNSFICSAISFHLLYFASFVLLSACNHLGLSLTSLLPIVFGINYFHLDKTFGASVVPYTLLLNSFLSLFVPEDLSVIQIVTCISIASALSTVLIYVRDSVLEYHKVEINLFRELNMIPFYLLCELSWYYGQRGELKKQVEVAALQWSEPVVCKEILERSGRQVACMYAPTWISWSTLVQTSPDIKFIPKCVEDIQEIVKLARANHKRVRVAGTGHSWSPIVDHGQNAYLIDITQMGKISIDTKNGIATIESGVSIGDLEKELVKNDVCLPANVILTCVRYGGVIATGSHGCGWNAQTVSDFVVGMTIVNGNGEVEEFSKEKGTSDEMMNIIKVNLGCLGVIHRIQLKVLPTYNIRNSNYLLPMEETMKDTRRMKQLFEEENESIEVFWFPTSHYMVMKAWNRTTEAVNMNLSSYSMKLWKLRHYFISHLLEFLPTRFIPLLTYGYRLFSCVSGVSNPSDAVHHQCFVENFPLLCTEWIFKLDEDFENLKFAWNAISDRVNAHAKQGRYPMNFIMELRICKGSDALLSPCKADQEGERYCFLEILSFHKNDGFVEFSAELTDLFMKNEKLRMRPHWAKQFQVTPEEEMNPYLRQSYGKDLQKFLRVREEMDPESMFLNPFLRRLFYGNQLEMSS